MAVLGLSASTISGLTALQISFYSKAIGSNYGAQGETSMSQFKERMY